MCESEVAPFALHSQEGAETPRRKEWRKENRVERYQYSEGNWEERRAMQQYWQRE
jgi:hypothetical protein